MYIILTGIEGRLWFYGSQHVRQVHLWGECPGQSEYREACPPVQGLTCAGSHPYPGQKSGKPNPLTPHAIFGLLE